MSEANIFWKNIKTIYRYNPPDSGAINLYGYEIRIGRWVVNGRDHEIVLAKQEFQILRDGKVLWGKIKGLSAGDVYRLFESARLISDTMEFPLPDNFPKQRELNEIPNK